MDSIGDTLRRERRRRNLEIVEVAAELKISARFLEAIEAEDFDKLPGGVFTKSFVRQYASCLGLDPEEMVAELQRRIEPPPPNPEALEKSRPDVPNIKVEFAEDWRSVGDRGSLLPSWISAGVWLVALMLVCSGLYWWWDRRHHPSIAELAPPSRVLASSSAPPQAQTIPPVASTPAPLPAASPEPAPVSPVTTAPPTVPAAAEAVTPAAAGTPNPTPEIPVLRPNPNATVRLGITADDSVWVRAEVNGKFLFSGTLQAHEVRNIDADGEIKLRLGNAGGATITLNGKPLGPVGPKGQPRTVQFTSGGFQIVSSAAKVPDLDRL